MYETKLVINNKTGLHARPASDLARLCAQYESTITMIHDKGVTNPKSIISIITGGIYAGTEVLLKVEGKDEKEAGEAISELIRNLKD